MIGILENNFVFKNIQKQLYILEINSTKFHITVQYISYITTFELHFNENDERRQLHFYEGKEDHFDSLLGVTARNTAVTALVNSELFKMEFKGNHKYCETIWIMAELLNTFEIYKRIVRKLV